MPYFWLLKWFQSHVRCMLERSTKWPLTCCEFSGNVPAVVSHGLNKTFSRHFTRGVTENVPEMCKATDSNICVLTQSSYGKILENVQTSAFVRLCVRQIPSPKWRSGFFVWLVCWVSVKSDIAAAQSRSITNLTLEPRPELLRFIFKKNETTPSPSHVHTLRSCWKEKSQY